MYLKILPYLLLSIIFLGCSNNTSTPKTKVNSFSFIQATVLEKFGDNLIVQVEDKEIVSGSTYDAKLANKIIKSSMFLIGQNTYLGDNKAKITDIRGSQVTFSTPSKIKKDDTTKIYIPKKTIAITDFEIIGYENKELNKEIIENLTTKFVQSGQYVVVERAKLNSVLKEHALIDSGLMDSKEAKKLGKLVAADVVLTGSFNKKGNIWNVNLRLVDVSTGIILHAINDSIPSNELGFRQYKESGNLNETFDKDKLGKGWSLSLYQRTGGKGKVSIINNGAKNTLKSAEIIGKLKKGGSWIGLHNLLNRDISSYKGIEFFAKSKDRVSLTFSIQDGNYDNAYRNAWVARKTLTPNWKKYRISFNELILAKGFASRNPGGDGVLDLDNILVLVFGLTGKTNDKNKKVSFNIDEIILY